jgi:glycosyltransferase involved in cell wall biosynthesis
VNRIDTNQNPIMKPLVSILIPAYNAEEWIAETIHSAIAQTWPHKEIIVVDDGSRDRTVDAARRFASKNVSVVSIENRGSAGARNHAMNLSQGDYIQWLDADDLLAPDKVERQVEALREADSERALLSCAWAYFHYRTERARFVPNSLWRDLTPVEWLLRKMSENLHMQTATWLTSRELAQEAGPWDERLVCDDDGEYFCRVLRASRGTHFVHGSKVFYRVSPSASRVSYIGVSNPKKDAMFLSINLHIQYLWAMEESDRVRNACLTYLQNWFDHFYPERPELVAELQKKAAELGGHLDIPRLRWKYAWLEPILGWKTAKRAQMTLPQIKASVERNWDRAMYKLERQKRGENITEVGSIQEKNQQRRA